MAALSTAPSAYALSEIQREELPAPAAPPSSEDGATSPEGAVPLPDPIQNMPPAAQTEPNAPDEPEQVEPGTSEDRPDAARPDTDEDGPLPEIVYDLSRLPEPVSRMRNLLVEAARSGNIEALRPLIERGENGTQLSFGNNDEDPIAFLKGLSGDTEGQEILAILEEVLSAGYAHISPGTPNEMYVWPYFFAIPLDKLDARQRVELFKIVTAGDYEDMKTYGSYIFYRLGITPEGRWAFFVAGD